MKWETVRLGDVLDYEQPTKYIIQNTDYCDSFKTPVLTAGQSFILGYTNENNNVFTENLPVIIFDDFTTAIKYVDFPFKVKSSAMKILKAQKDINIKYLYYYMSTISVDTELHKRYWISQYSNIKISLPPINIQNETVNVLNRVNSLIEKRKEQIAVLDLLIRSQFINMFGDPVTNPMGWEVISLRESSLRISDGPFGSNLKTEHYTDSGVRVVRLGNIGVSEFIDYDKAFISVEHYETLKKYTCLPNDIIIGTLGEPNLRACILPNYIKKAINKSDCVHYKPNRDIANTYFVCEYLNQPAVLSIAGGSIHGQTRSRISMSQVAALPIFIPPLTLQNRFADFAQQVDKLKIEMQQGLNKLEMLNKSLMQKCFNGEVL